METSCLLIVPYYTSGEGSILKSFDYTMPPVGLLSIAGWLQQNKIKVNLLDFTIENFKKNNVEDILQNKIKSIGVPEWFGISVCTPVAYNAYYIAKILKTLYPKSKIVLGGLHITVLKEQIFSEKELFKAQRSMYIKFYLRPIIIFNYLKKLSSFTALANMFRGILGFLKIIRFSK